MTKISQYPEIATPDVDDLLVGTDVENSNATKNFTIQSIIDLVGTGTTPTLQQVTDEGNTTNQTIIASSFIKSSGTSDQYLMADGTVSVAFKTYNETVILLSYDGTNFTYTNVINELGVTITFLVLSGTLYCTLSSSVLTEGKTIIWASSFVEFGGYLTQALRSNGTSFTLSLTNTNGTNNTFPTSFTNLPVRIQVYN